MLSAFTAGLLLITVFELGDKSFFIAMLLAMRHSRFWVFTGATLALALMTLLSVAMGQLVAFLPKVYIHHAAIAIFLGFGCKLLYDASRMSNQPDCEEVESAKAAIAQAQANQNRWGQGAAITLQSFTLTFLAEWGDRTQFSTIGLAATYDPWGIALGATAGHMVSAAIAVLGGRLVAAYLSERLLTIFGGILFIGFGLASCLEPV